MQEEESVDKLLSSPSRTTRNWRVWSPQWGLHSSRGTYLDREHGNSLGRIDVVPDTQGASVLCDHDITEGDPLRSKYPINILHRRIVHLCKQRELSFTYLNPSAVVENSSADLTFNIQQMKLKGDPNTTRLLTWWMRFYTCDLWCNLVFKGSRGLFATGVFFLGRAHNSFSSSLHPGE